MKLSLCACIALSLYGLSDALADPIAAGITVSAPWLRATPHGAPVAGGYATITNSGKTSDRLVAASIPTAPRGEVHAMSMDHGVMHMARLDKGLDIAPGQSIVLSPGGYHLMFVNPTAPLKEGETIRGSLTFEKAGAISVTFTVAGMAAKSAPGTSAPALDKRGMNMRGMDMQGMEMKAH